VAIDGIAKASTASITINFFIQAPSFLSFLLSRADLH
jgi:hypothetical protein